MELKDTLDLNNTENSGVNVDATNDGHLDGINLKSDDIIAHDDCDGLHKENFDDPIETKRTIKFSEKQSFHSVDNSVDEFANNNFESKEIKRNVTNNNPSLSLDLYTSSIAELHHTPSIIQSEFMEENPAGVTKLKELMLYKTIQFMDYRRLRRRFNGIRRPVSNKKALFICLFCIALALVPFIYFRVESDHYVAGVQIQRGVIPYIASLSFVLGAFLLAKIQLSLPLKFPVILSYLFMFAALIVLVVLRNIISVQRFIWPILICYTIAQIIVILITRIVIYLVPLLALNGLFFPCTEHFHLLQRFQQGRRLNITISRYNDYTIICGLNVCGLGLCLYRCAYRWIRWCYRKYKNRSIAGAHQAGLFCMIISYTFVDGALFSHQMRYNGEVDENSIPHGYGEWLEDHTYGERLQGYWWHGYPIGPFTSQEIGSGSLFVNTRVAFVTDTHLPYDKIRFGVSSTECSISGHFFKEMPKTYFFNPLYHQGSSHPNRLYSKINLFNVLREKFDGIPGSSPQWCIRMLKPQFYLNMPNRQGIMNIYVDKLTNSLKIDGFRRINHGMKRGRCDEITIRLSGRSCKNRLLKPRSNSGYSYRTNSGSFKPLRIARLYRKSKVKGVESGDLSKEYKLLHYRSEISNSSDQYLGVRSEISNLFRDEDDWENKQHLDQPQVVVNGWMPIRSFGRLGYIPEQAVIYIHGYNLRLSEACSQMAHIVSFSKLPPYILPIVFNWDGHHWGWLSAFSYPVAMKAAENPNLEDAFHELLQEFAYLGIKHIHLLVHSCGARIFFKVINSSISKGLITPVVDEQHLVHVGKGGNNIRMRMDTCILINPDYPLERFVDHDYFVLRGYCDHIVLYVDTRDQCLTFSEWYHRERSLGRSIFGMCTSPHKLASIRKSDDIKVDKNEPFTIYSGEGYTIPPGNLKYISNKSLSLDHPPMYDCQNDKSVKILGKPEEQFEESTTTCQPKYSSKMFGTQNIFWIGRMSNANRGIKVNDSFTERSLWLDIDVIDTTMIDTNVDFLKHSFYQMKREIMDDIREVILMHTRAEYRQTRLDRRRGNVYVFRVAPANVNNLFGR
ncbi:hypothetical protein BEWA_019750 [Theileria equi strain WA]|uniref:Uncharacterized protein n=1 Tax=Theileria equi strain WA TaxID=1537102 RepID=L0AW52_THEEQ|nr:hypothetical protein BEWA_019750 [Theileria equi strain WA]AFZ79129.1 hypothetical protein BEWA_019750 [Theileria equi strain WA]|eukprot:XP_004828795.1 hypothetical protein BEWA_019750 [Theileria equi strain WA]